MATEMVMAYGDHGLELTPVEDVVAIPVVPLGPKNEVLPVTLRFWKRHESGGDPTRLLRVEKPSARSGGQYVYVRFECTPYVSYTTADGPVYRTERGCHVRNAADANDPFFAGLTSRERARIAKAVAAVELREQAQEQ